MAKADTTTAVETPPAEDPKILDPGLEQGDKASDDANVTLAKVVDAAEVGEDAVAKFEQAFGEIRLIAAELLSATSHGPGLVEKAGAALHAIADRFIPRT